MFVSERAPGCECRKTQLHVFFIWEVPVEGRLQGRLIHWPGDPYDLGSCHLSALHPDVSFPLETMPLMAIGWLPATVEVTCFLIHFEQEKETASRSSPR